MILYDHPETCAAKCSVRDRCTEKKSGFYGGERMTVSRRVPGHDGSRGRAEGSGRSARKTGKGALLCAALCLVLLPAGGCAGKTARPAMATPSPARRPAATAKPAASTESKTVAGGPPFGKKLSRDDGLYFLGGGKVDGISADKFRYLYGSKYYVVYLDRDYIIVKVEDYLPGSSSGKASAKGKTGGTKHSTEAYPAGDYLHPEDFYYDYYDDFIDYEDAEDYWETHR